MCVVCRHGSTFPQSPDLPTIGQEYLMLIENSRNCLDRGVWIHGLLMGAAIFLIVDFVVLQSISNDREFDPVFGAAFVFLFPTTIGIWLGLIQASWIRT